MFLWFVLVILVLWTVFRYKRRRMYELASKLPSTGRDLPLIGITYTLAGNNEDIMDILKQFSYTSMKNKGLVHGWLGFKLYFLTTAPLDTEMILKTCLEKDDLHRFLRKITGNGGIFAPVSIWRRRRKIAMPAFSPKIVENFVEVFSEQSNKLVKRLEEFENTGSFSVWPFISAFTLDSVSETAMGVKINAQGNPKTPMLVSTTKVFHLACKRIFHLWLQPDWLFKLSPYYEEHQECLRILHAFTENVIKKKREEICLENKSETETEVNKPLELGSYKTSTFLDLLIRFSGGEKGYTNEELRDEVITFTLAGTDTSAVAICYTLLLLAKYPKVQERLFNEVYDVFGDSDRPLTKEDFSKLEYLTRVVKESLRLFPPVPFVIRKILEDLKLPSGHVVPGGSGAVVSIWGMHRDPQYWGPNAEEFDPDRFLPERLKLPHACCYMPFSQGPRNCLGYQYALMSIKTAISSIVRRYKVVGEPETTPVPHIRVRLDVMMKAVDEYKITLERRKQQSTTS